MDSETIASERAESRLPSTADSSSNSDSDESGSSAPQTEWLATARERRSTAGNRMKSILANEEPDSDLELLFAEDDDDQGFTDVEDAGSDVHMDSSSDDEDENHAVDDLEGEKELERQARERRAAQRKRKAQDAIPVKFRKKVRITPTTPAAPAPRPKKKSERASWLPSPADLPTRASSRQTTRLSKEQLHQQMVEREAKRLKQLAQMQKKAAKLEAMKKPPMTQEERLREAALVEKRNSKSLNRWEVAEKQREEERRAKLAALNNRTLKGPVITFWSGMGEVVDGKLKHVGRYVVMEEKPDKPKKQKKGKGDNEGKSGDGLGGKADAIGTEAAPVIGTPQTGSEGDRPQAESSTAAEVKDSGSTAPVKIDQPPEQSTATEAPPANPSTPTVDDPPRLMAMPPLPPPLPSGLAAPAPPPPASTMALPSGLARPPEAKPSSVLAAPVLAPPPGISIDGPAPPRLGYGSTNPRSNVLALPDTSQRSAPPTISGAVAERPPLAQPLPLRGTHLQPIQNQAIPKRSPSITPSEPVPEPEDSTFARNAIIFQNFDDNALKDKGVQTQILFGRKMNRLSKPHPAPLCVITHHPARYRDPATGLPYFNAYAYREIQRLRRGEYKWSRLLGAWVGSGTYAAKGVPERFLNPKKEKEKKKAEGEEEAKGDEKTSEKEAMEETVKNDLKPADPASGAVEAVH